MADSETQEIEGLNLLKRIVKNITIICEYKQLAMESISFLVSADAKLLESSKMSQST